MTKIKSALNPRSAEFQANADALKATVTDLQAEVSRVKLGGGERSRERHLGRGKLLPRDRVLQLLDPGCMVVIFRQLAS